MAVDSSLFGADIPAGTYARGDVINLGIISGPAVVRSGRGTAILKRILGGVMTEASGAATYWRIHVKNSDWIDDAECLTSQISTPTFLDQHSGATRPGNNQQLTPNSSWQVYAECILGGTTTAANSIFALIDIDYPEVSAITDPDALIGVPASIDYDKQNATINAFGSLTSSAWETENVDYFKAGWMYALQEVSIFSPSVGGSPVGFVSFSNAAGMGGLSRIIPVSADPGAIRQTIEYASLLVKGPMDIKTMLFMSSAQTADIVMIHDFVKRKR